jgi:hypothetical protein
MRWLAKDINLDEYLATVEDAKKWDERWRRGYEVQ